MAFCTSCDSKGTFHKKDCPLFVPRGGKKEIPATSQVTTEEFESFKKNVEITQNKILDLLEKALEPQGKQVQAKVVSEEALEGLQISGKYRDIFEKYFDPADGFQAYLDYPDRGKFTILVPLRFSQESPAYKDYYKRTLHTVVIRGTNVEQEIDEWCKKVARNLRYDKKIQTKEYAA